MMTSSTAGLGLDHFAMAGRRSTQPPSRAGANLPRSRRVFWSVEQAPDALRDADMLRDPAVEPDADPSDATLPNGTIEITLADGTRVRVDNHVDATALRRVLEVLRQR